MKAVLNASRFSNNSQYNGLTFDVVSLNQHTFTLLIDGKEVEFEYKEIILIDFQAEYQRTYDAYNWNSSSTLGVCYHYLKAYAEEHWIKFTPEYNCPA